MVTEAADKVLPVELGFQMLCVYRMGRDLIKRIIGSVIVDAEPGYTYATTTTDGRALRVTFSWNVPADAVEEAKARIIARVTAVLADIFPDSPPPELDYLTDGLEFDQRKALRLTGD